MNMIPGNEAEYGGDNHLSASVTFRLPYPPSVNGLFFNAGKRRVMTKEYVAWRVAACWEMRAQRVPVAPFVGSVAVDIHLKRPDKRKRDLDNCAKATLDALVAGGVIDDDSQIVDLRIHWGASEPCLVTISQA